MERTGAIQQEQAEPDSLGVYLGEIRNHPILTRRQEQVIFGDFSPEAEADELLGSSSFVWDMRHEDVGGWRQVFRDSETVRDVIISTNLRLVASVALRKYPSVEGADLLDLIQEGNEKGLVKAIENFDVERGFKFSTYAVFWIRKTMARYMAEHSTTIKVPIDVDVRLRKVERAIEEFFALSGREPSHEELVAIVGKDNCRKSVMDARERRIRSIASLDRPLDENSGGDSSTLMDFIDSSAVENESGDDSPFAGDGSVSEFLEELQRVLTEREFAVLRMRFGFDGQEPKYFKEVGRELGFSGEAARLNQISALDKLRRSHRVRKFGLNRN